MAPRLKVPPLMDELVAEVLLRLPTAQPASLFRAAAVSRKWHQLVSNDDALRRYREHHRVPPLLGFFQNTEYAGDNRPPFVPTTDCSPPFSRPNFDCDYWMALDCRHGRVLVHTLNPLSLLVWNPITAHRDKVPLPAEEAFPYNHFAAAVLCAAEGCDHLDCGGAPFRVVFTATSSEDVEEVITWASVYSSDTGAWTVPLTIQPGAVMDSPDVMGPGLLLDDSVYFPLDLLERRAFVVYHLAQNTLSLLEGPPIARRDMVLVAAEGNRVGVAIMDNNILQVLSRPVGQRGDWSHDKFVTLESTLLRDLGNIGIHVAGYAEAANNVVYLSGNDGVAMLDLQSGKGKKVSNVGCFSPVLSYVTFFTHGVRAGVEANIDP
ncbi:hypothetical protein QOZ80_7AG0553510 [Eleusine coracana subsp. coracana]|nr:hypothetical protein QOZ80_7AG0553510 [Eleusine coracana subsp. coracana]